MIFEKLIPFFLLLFLKKTLELSRIKIIIRINIIFIFFFSSISLWSFFIQRCSIYIWLCYAYIISFVILFSFLFYTLTNWFILLQYKPIFITILLSLFYHSGMLIHQNIIFPIFYPLIFFSHWASYGLPFFTPHLPWLYCFAYFIILYHSDKKIIYIYAIIGLLFFCQSKEKIYWIENQKDNQNLKNYYYKNNYVFPEAFIEIKNNTNLKKYCKISKKTKKRVILGCQWEELDQPYQQNGIAIISPDKKIDFQKKYPIIPFAETKTKYENEENQKKYTHIMICSEFFLLPLPQQIEIKNEIIIVASTKWTQSILTFWGQYIMESIFRIYQYSLR